MGNGGLIHAEHSGNVTDAHFILSEHIKNLDSGGIAKNLEKLRQIVEDFIARKLLINFLDDFFVNTFFTADRDFRIGHDWTSFHMNICSCVYYTPFQPVVKPLLKFFFGRQIAKRTCTFFGRI